ncbi:rhodanese-like domain-containing protein, partial [Flavobacteriales bacterium]|nr:rhodanese-like domain-containing protein [Flavobacteriales bacterium]
AARLWWILKIYGHKKISLLNGGLSQYRQLGGALVTEVTESNPGNFTFVGKGVGLEAKRQLVASVLNREGWTIIDARSIEEYLGQVYSKNCKKKGRIPGSMPIDWSYGVDYHGNQKFKAVGELSKMFAAKGITSDKNVITYCRSGVRSAHTTFVLTELLGYPNVYNYDGSWLEWSGIDALPVELKK